MNEDAEAWIDGQLPNSLEAEMMRQAMRWAYADAADVIRNQEIGQFRDDYQDLDADEPLAQLIEARAK